MDGICLGILWLCKSSLWLALYLFFKSIGSGNEIQKFAKWSVALIVAVFLASSLSLYQIQEKEDANNLDVDIPDVTLAEFEKQASDEGLVGTKANLRVTDLIVEYDKENPIVPKPKVPIDYNKFVAFFVFFFLTCGAGIIMGDPANRPSTNYYISG